MKLLYEQKKNACTTKTIQQMSYGINNLQAEQDNMLLMHKKEQQQLVAIQQSIEKDVNIGYVHWSVTSPQSLQQTQQK